MEINEKRILELFLGLIFVALLIMIVLLVIYLPTQGQTPASSNVISNSYNTNSFNEYALVETQNRNYRDKDYGDFHEKRDFLDYHSYGEHSRGKTFFNNYRDEFRVNVVNKDHEGGYFKVKFVFCDYEDNCFSETMEKYISAGEEREFYYVDVHEGKYEYYDWEYKIFPDKSD